MKDSVKKLLSEDSAEEIKRLITIYPNRKSAILMVLHVIHRQFGFIERQAIHEAADIMEISAIDLDQAASFYTYFPSKRVGKYHIQVCRTLSCYLNGAEELASQLKKILGIDLGGTTTDGLFSLVEVECLGSCGTGPMMQINDVYYEKLNPRKVEQIIADLRQKAKNG